MQWLNPVLLRFLAHAIHCFTHLLNKTFLLMSRHLNWVDPGGRNLEKRMSVPCKGLVPSVVWSLGREDPLEKGMGTHSSILVWRIPWTGKPGGYSHEESRRVGHGWATNSFTFTGRWVRTTGRHSAFHVVEEKHEQSLGAFPSHFGDAPVESHLYAHQSL